MSEYQRYEFMAVDRPLTRAQIEEVDSLSSHIEVSSTHAVVEYNYGDFKHDPISVLRDFFDGFLYWANWGSPRLALRFPHGALPNTLLAGYDFDEFYVNFSNHKDYDILDIHFYEREAPDMWTEYDLGSLISLRDELLEGDLRSLYIVWLATEGGISDEEETEEQKLPPVPANFGNLTGAQKALAELFQVSDELLGAAAQHSTTIPVEAAKNDFAMWVKLLPQERGNDYLVRMAQNEPGLSRLLVKELRELGLGKQQATLTTGEHVSYATLLADSKGVKARLDREKREQKQLARERHLQDIHDHQTDYWRQVDMAAVRGTGTGYDEATKLLVELREAAEHFKESQAFQTRFQTWITAHLRRPAFIKRLQGRGFPI